MHLIYRSFKRAFLLTLLLVLTAAPAGAQTVEALLARASSLINSGQHQQALDLLGPYEVRLAGEPVYDYLYGLALLESGEAGRAALALERAVEQDASFAGARLDLARAYYVSGDLGAAREQLEILRTLNPPPAAQQAIEEYLTLIANRQRRLRMEYRFSSRAGYDSNANSATSANQFLGFDLIERSREVSTPFAELGGGVVLLKPLSARLLLDSRINLKHRNNPDASFINSTSGDISAGLRFVKEGETRSVRLQTYRLNIDGDLNSKGVALTGSWEKTLRRDLRGGVFARIGQTRYGNSLQVKDVNQWMLGTTANWSFGTGGSGSVGGAVLYGNDDPRQADSRYGRDLYGLRINLGWSFNPQIRTQFTAGLMQSDYDAVFFEQQFSSPREDTMTTAGISVKWRVSPKWLMSHDVMYVNNDTDIEIFSFERVETSVTFSRLWQ